ncbi:MAG: hypothetical protein WCL44_15930 [bacterium]
MRQGSRVLLVAAAILAAPLVLHAQYAMDMKLDNTSYLQFESMEARVVVRNDTDRMLLVGGLRETASIDFIINRGNEPVRRRSAGLIVENTLIMPGQTREVVVDLGRHYNIQTIGQYEITATFTADRGTYKSAPTIVDVVPGLELTNVRRSVPNHPSMIRKYSLRYWSRQNREMLFLCVTDEKEGINYGVFMLGPIVRVIPPEISVDSSGEVRVRHQADNGVFAHTALKSTAEGVALVRQQIKTEDVRLPGGGKPAK